MIALPCFLVMTSIQWMDVGTVQVGMDMGGGRVAVNYSQTLPAKLAASKHVDHNCTGSAAHA